MTASEIAKVTGISTATVSTMLTKMAKTGELPKAERGYKLPQWSKLFIGEAVSEVLADPPLDLRRHYRGRVRVERRH